MSGAYVGFGPKTRTVHVGADVVGVAVWNSFQGAWEFREPRFKRFHPLVDKRFDSRAELGSAVAQAAKLDVDPPTPGEGADTNAGKTPAQRKEAS